MEPVVGGIENEKPKKFAEFNADAMPLKGIRYQKAEMRAIFCLPKWYIKMPGKKRRKKLDPLSREEWKTYYEN